MKSLIVASSLAMVATFACGAAMAAPPATHAATSSASAQTTKFKEHTSNGAVKSYADSTRNLMLKDGRSFHLASNVTPANFKKGEKVQIHWKSNGKIRDADQVTLKN